MNILHRNMLELGGFAGLKEHRLVIDNRLFINRKTGAAFSGLGNLVYLADAKFLPLGETKMHSHKEIDVVSVMVEGQIRHEGSLGHGQMMQSNQIQVQRAGGKGFSHNEINPDKKENRMIQLWFLPEIANQEPGYKLYEQKTGKLTRVYGGKTIQEATFDNHTFMDIGLIRKEEQLSLSGEFMAYITKGTGMLNGTKVKDGDLIRDKDLELSVEADMQIIIIRTC